MQFRWSNSEWYLIRVSRVSRVRVSRVRVSRVSAKVNVRVSIN